MNNRNQSYRSNRQSNMPERDEEGRFVSNDRGYSGGGRYADDEDYGRSQSGRGQGRRYENDDDHRSSRSGRGQGQGQGHGGWFGDSEGHSEAARRGWEEREGGRSRSSRDEEDDDYQSSGRGVGRSRSARYENDDDYQSSGRSGGRGQNHQGHGGWFGDSEGHSEASRRGWQHRR